MNDFITNLAASLAYDLFKVVARRLSSAMFGDEEQEALRRAYEHAFAAMLQHTASQIDQEMSRHFESLLRSFVKDEAIANILLDSALEGRELPLSELRARFEDLGFDSKTLPIDFDAALRAFLGGLEEGLQQEAAQPGSPLYNQVSLGQLTSLKRLVDKNHQLLETLVAGLSCLPTNYAPFIKNFFTEYLGTPQQPVPFGGRETELGNLDAWLNDDNASRYLLLASSAGGGKSALLVRWSQRLLERSDLAVVFIPVSVRFNTNLSSVVFSALTARLAELHGEEPSRNANMPVEAWRTIALEYLARRLPDGRRLIIILDGVDEAADWRADSVLLPMPPPPHLRVIVSARLLAGDTDAIAWMHRLGWDHPGLARTLDLNL